MWSAHWRSKHINILELQAVILACRAFQNQLTGVVTRLHIDNSTVVAHLNKEGGTKSHALVLLTRDLLLWCDIHRIQVQAVHIAGVRNVVADSLSRRGQLQASEWSLSGQEFVRVSGFWGRPEVDLMATASNRRCREFISPIPHPEALGVDAFAATWPVVKLAYVYPPASIVGRVIQLIRRQRPHRIILIASMAASRPFHAELREMAVSPPVPVAREFGTLVQQLSSEDRQRIHALPHLFQLGAWLLSAQ